MSAHPNIETLRNLVHRDQEFFKAQSQRLTEIQQSDPSTLSDADRNAISSWDKSVVKDCNRQLVMLEDIEKPTPEEREIMKELNKLITLGDHIMERRNMVQRELSDRLNAMKKAAKLKSAVKSQAGKSDQVSTPPVSTPPVEEPIHHGGQGPEPAEPCPPAAPPVPAAASPATQSPPAVEDHVPEETPDLPEPPKNDDDAFTFDPKLLYAVIKIEPDASLQDVKKAAKKVFARLHPDKKKDDPDAGEKFANLSGACRVFEDEDTRREFDETGNVVDLKDLQLRLRALDWE